MSTGHQDIERDGGAAGSLRPARLRLPWGLVGMLTLVLIVEEIILPRYDLDLTAPWHWDWRLAGFDATHSAAGSDILLFGDSLVKFGLVPRVLRDQTGATVHNFALHTGQAVSAFFLLQRIVESEHRPRTVVIDPTMHVLAALRVDTQLWPELFTVGETLDFARTLGDSGVALANLAAIGLPSVRYRLAIRSALLAQVTGQPSPSRRAVRPMYQRNWRVNRGGQVMPFGPNPPIDPDEWERTIYPRWEPDPTNVAYLDRFVALADRSGIAVVLLLPPVQPSLRERTERNGFDAAATRFVQGVVHRHPKTRVIDARRSGFGATEFNDGIHLHRPGAIRLSLAVGSALNHGGLSTPWTELVVPAGTPDLPGVEDLYQSGLAVQTSPTRR